MSGARIDPYVKAVLDRWLFSGLDDLYRLEPFEERPGMLLGCALWGARFVERFVRWCVPSLLEPHNADALARSGSRIVIAAPVSEMRRLFAPLRQLELAGIDVQILPIPLEVMAEVAHEDNGNYLLLAVAQALLVRHAARTGLGYHMLMPDHVYTLAYFANLVRLTASHPAIVQNTISANVETAANELQAFRQGDGSIAVPAVALGDIGWRHLHAQMRQLTMRPGVRDYPDSHYMIWTAADRLCIYSPHGNIAWMDNDRCRRAPIIVPTTIDAQLPSLLPGGAYMPRLEDRLVLIELSDDGKPAAARVPLADFLARCAMSIDLRREYLDWFRAPSFVPIAFQTKCTPAPAITRQHARICRQIEEALDRIEGEAKRRKAVVTLEASQVLAPIPKQVGSEILQKPPQRFLRPNGRSDVRT